MLSLVIVLLAVSLHTSLSGHPMRDYGDHPCIRTCEVNDSMTCEYTFIAEYYYTLTKACLQCPYNVTHCQRRECIPADGNSRAIAVINRLLPGPAIQICEGDTVVVNLYNKLLADGMSIHWHGVLQNGSPHMDGVSMITQCHVPAYTSFQYRFTANDPGTHFWHGHSGVHRSDGIFGAFVVRQAAERELHHGLYDYDLPEHTMLVNDWLVELSLDRFANHHQASGDNKPASMLINGKGAHRVFYDSEQNKNFTTPLEVFNVTHGRRYRFRIISNGILNCPIQISVDNHTLLVIASDGNPFRPVSVESFNIFAGERFDVVILADQPVDNYWIRARGQADCGVKQAHEEAILRYNGAAEEHPSLPKEHAFGNRGGKKINPWNQKGTDMLIQVSDLETLLPPNKALQEIPDKKFYMAMDFNNIDNFNFYVGPEYLSPAEAVEGYNHLLSPQINHISNTLPPSPLLTQYNDIPQEMFCNADTVRKNCSAEFCQCVHTIKVDLDDTVELIVIDEGKVYNANHPMHLHGHKFRVVGMDRLDLSTTIDEVKELDMAGMLPRNLTSAVDKDTVTVPDGGYVILRVHANNPGFWFMHCHIEFHARIGMAFILQVGELDDMPDAPPNFPRCGSWEYSSEQTPPTTPDPVGNAFSVKINMMMFISAMILSQLFV